MKESTITEQFVYPIEVFSKYKNLNKLPHANFEKYFITNIDNSDADKNGKNSPLTILDKPDIRSKLNYIITKKNVSNEDTTIFSAIRYNLNKVTNKMLSDDKNNSFQVIINALTNIPYSKVEHFQKLAEIVLDKAINEPKFCCIYAKLCYELAGYYIEVKNKQIYFRHILLNMCESEFDRFFDKLENIDKEKIQGLMRFLGELYNKKLLTTAIIIGCFDRLGTMIEKSPFIVEGISALLLSSYQTIRQEHQQYRQIDKSYEYIFKKLNKHLTNEKLTQKNKFTIQNTLDFIKEIDEKHKDMY